MVYGKKSAKQALACLRKVARRKGYSVEQVVNPATGRPRGNGSHEIWALMDDTGNEIARGGLTKHPGDMSWTVTRSFEEAFEKILGEGWMDR